MDRAEGIRARIEALRIEHAGRELDRITISIGVASVPGHCTADRLIRTADAALYRAKATGRNRVVMATSRIGSVAG